jgi:hypothetical protein
LAASNPVGRVSLCAPIPSITVKGDRRAIPTLRGTAIMRRNTMFDETYEAEQVSGTPSDVPISGSRIAGDRSMTFDCCGTRMDGEMAECPCGSMMRRHPVVMFAILAVMGLALLLIPAGAILGIIAFFGTI